MSKQLIPILPYQIVRRASLSSQHRMSKQRDIPCYILGQFINQILLRLRDIPSWRLGTGRSCLKSTPFGRIGVIPFVWLWADVQLGLFRKGKAHFLHLAFKQFEERRGRQTVSDELRAVSVYHWVPRRQ